MVARGAVVVFSEVYGEEEVVIDEGGRKGGREGG